MKLGCFQSNTALREMEYAAFVEAVAGLGYAAADIPLGEANAAETCRQHGLDVHSAGPLFLPDMSEEDSAAGGDRPPWPRGDRFGGATGRTHRHHDHRPRAGPQRR